MTTEIARGATIGGKVGAGVGVVGGLGFVYVGTVGLLAMGGGPVTVAAVVTSWGFSSMGVVAGGAAVAGGACGGVSGGVLGGIIGGISDLGSRTWTYFQADQANVQVNQVADALNAANDALVNNIENLERANDNHERVVRANVNQIENQIDAAADVTANLREQAPLYSNVAEGIQQNAQRINHIAENLINPRLEQEILQLREERDNFQKQLENTREDLSKAMELSKQHITKKRQRIKELNASIRRLEQDNIELIKERETFQQQINHVEGSRDDAIELSKAQITKYREKIKNQEQEIKQLKNYIFQLEEQQPLKDKVA